MKTMTRLQLGSLRGCRAARIVCSTKAFSLPELMITLLVSGILVIGMVGGYMVQKRSYEDEASMIDMQMNGRIAMDRAAEVVRNAGLGCVDNFPPKDNQTVQSLIHVDNFAFRYTQFL